MRSNDSPVVETAARHRPEIQGLRAIAVLVVLVFHIWPTALPGGYVGVDVFFVISGYLITGLLLREQLATGAIDLVRFYGRRAKRLLPAASAVMLAVALGAAYFFPRMRWGDLAQDIMASALYAENWLLASRAVDYLAAEEGASPLQHFWSLAIEEQYYLLWPALLLFAGWLVRKSGWRLVPVAGALLAGVFVVSLAYSMRTTELNPGFAYFATTTRAWELALGGLLAVFSGWRALPERVRALAAWTGVAMIGAAAFLFDGETVFPGNAALLPTVGSALVLISGTTAAGWSAYRWLRLPPMQWVGDLSYSLYLWHWPLVSGYRAVWGEGEIGLAHGAILFAASIAMAWSSKRFVEDRFRAPQFASRTRWQPITVGATSMLVIVCAGSALAAIAARIGPPPAQGMAQGSLHPGALALVGAQVPPGVPFVPSVESARNDLAEAYAANCISPSIGRDLRECRYGPDDAALNVVAVGDSHMVQWLPALQVLAQENGWRLLALTKTGCAFAVLDETAMTSEGMKSCAEWNTKVLRRIVDAKPDLVFVAQSSGALGEIAKDASRGPADMAARMAQAWRGVASTQARLIVFRETPRLGWDSAECLSRPDADIAACTQLRASAVPSHSAIESAAALQPGVVMIDLTDTMCTAVRCPPVIGNILVWRDKHHLTASYARTIAPLLAQRLAARVPGLPLDGKEGAHARRLRRAAIEPALAGGLDSLPFDYEIRINGVVRTRDGRAVREFGMEFLEADVAAVDSRVAEAFGGVGYRRAEPTVHGHATRSVYRKPGNPEVLVWVRRGAPRGERYRIQSPAAKGTVYMAWDLPTAAQ